MKLTKLTNPRVYDFCKTEQERKKLDAFIKHFRIVAFDFFSGDLTDYTERWLYGFQYARERKRDRRYSDPCLFDHCAIWEAKDGSRFLTSLPYNTPEGIARAWAKFSRWSGPVLKFRYEYLDSEYKYRENGDFMIMVSPKW